MNFQNFKITVLAKTQDSQGKLPTNFEQWTLVINEGIKRLERELNLVIAELKVEIKTTDSLENESSNIPIIEDLSMALVYYVSQIYISDIGLKQKYILDYEDEKGIYIWNKFKEMEMNK